MAPHAYVSADFFVSLIPVQDSVQVGANTHRHRKIGMIGRVLRVACGQHLQPTSIKSGLQNSVLSRGPIS